MSLFLGIYNMVDYLARLRELTPTLPSFPPTNIQQPGWLEWETKGGKCFGWSLLHKPEISICKSFMTQGCIFPKHHHEAKEFLIVFEGKIVLYHKDDCFEIGVGDIHIVQPMEDHAVEAVEDSTIIGITIPAIKEYPK